MLEIKFYCNQNISSNAWFKQLVFFKGDNLVAIGGRAGSYLSDVEVIGVQKENTYCNPNDLPYAVEGHSTVASDKGLITCGNSSQVILFQIFVAALI